jgi:peptide/nickel transport system substrate-binding protein
LVVKRWFVGLALVVTALALVASGCGGSSKKSSGGTTTAPSGSSGGGAKGGTLLTVAAAAPSGSPDPQVNYTLQEWQLLITTHDGLVGFKRASGKEGTKIVADLAQSIPKPTNGGKLWTFKLRPGIKFSDGSPLTGNDVKATFNRIFKIGDSPNAGSWYNVIQGADACLKTPKTCDLSGVTVNGNTVKFALTEADPEFLDKLAVPFAFILPASTPPHNVSIPPPGTGPYMWKTYAPTKQLVLVRNPHFKQWSADAQPNGNPDEIVQKIGLQPEAQVTAVENNTADWMFDQPPADRLGELSTKYADRVHINPLTATWYMAMNVNVPPFNNLKVRQAINYATDRNALVKIYGGPKLAQPTCQILPPNFPGYKPYCPYTSGSDTTKWSGIDLAKAKQLVQESGTKGAKVVVNSGNDETSKALAEQMVTDMDSIGYKASTQLLADGIQYPYVQNSKNHSKWNIAWSAWYQDYPAPSDFLNVLLGCGSIHPNSDASPNIAAFCDKSIQAKMDQAEQTGVTDPNAANAIWAQVDHDMTDQAPWVDLYNPKQIDFLSKRVGGYQWNPQWYILIDQMWVQ